MKKKIALLTAATVFALFLAGSSYIYGLITAEDESESAAEAAGGRKPAPDFTVKDSNGKDIKLSDMRGKPTVVNFWASWCPPCRSEMPHFNKVYKEIGNEVNFMMIDLPGGGETQKVSEKFLKDQGLSFPVYYDTTGEASSEYDVNAIPTSIFIDKDGNIASTYTGAMSLETLRKGIETARQ